MVLVVDARNAGISGDMILSGLVDMGADGDRIISAVERCAPLLEGSTIDAMSFRRDNSGGIGCTRLVLDTKDPPSRPADDMIRAIREAVQRVDLSEAASEFALRSIKALVSAEHTIHHDTITHLHEAASIDTLVDIVGTAAALDILGISGDMVLATPINVGGGSVSFSHGTFANPAPAILQIIRDAGLVMFGDDTSTEMTTPTGASILAGLQARPIPFYPQVMPHLIGYGAGSVDMRGRSNTLCVVHGDDIMPSDTISVIQTNLDDATGEVIGETISAVMALGAVDAMAYTGTGKKGRPAHTLTVLCDHTLVQDVAKMLIQRTGTLGVRITESGRYILPREIRTISVTIQDTPYTIHYKVYTHHDNTSYKVEFDDLVIISAETGLPPRDIERIVRRAIDG